MTRYYAEADAEVHEAAEFYEGKLQGLGDSFLDEIGNAIEAIEQHPRRWPISHGFVRRHLVARFPYAILYFTFHEEIIVVAVMHLSRDPSYWFSRVAGIFDD